MKNTRQLQIEDYCAALYMRLSKDDEGAAESASITAQRKMLQVYAQENHFTVYDEYVDDGISGTTFDRPDFKRMIQDIEDKKVNLVITKDLSRLGRDYILAGQYTEIYFPSRRVRYIAINDGYDSDSPYTDIAPFKNVINEMYARDTSKKIRSAFVTRMQEGAFVGAFAPYGYRRDPYDKHHLVVDPEPAKVVKTIFLQAAEGVLPSQIARELNQIKIPTPLEYRSKKSPSSAVMDYTGCKQWTSATITKMLKNVVYLGHMAQGKTTKVSFKSDTSITNPQNEWYIVENTHEPLVSKDLFEVAARRSSQRTCIKKGQFNNLFSGIAKCADCGRNMSTVGTRKKGATANLACGSYKLNGSGVCTNHFIDYDTLCYIVLASIQKSMQLSKAEEVTVLEKVQLHMTKQTEREKSKNEIAVLKKRSSDLDLLVEQLYQDHVEGLLGTDRMRKLLARYEEESNQIEERLKCLVEGTSQTKENPMAKARKLLQNIINPTELTQEMLFHLIDHIEIGQGTYSQTEYGKRKQQKVTIYFRFIDNHV